MSLVDKRVLIVLLLLLFAACDDFSPDCEIATLDGERITIRDVEETGSKIQPIPPLKERMALTVDIFLATIENEKKMSRPIEGAAALRIYRGYLAKLRKNGEDPVVHFSSLAKKYNLTFGTCYLRG